MGFGGKSGIVGEGWRTLAAAAAPVMASFPDRVLSAVANALLQLGEYAGRPAQPVDSRSGTIAPRCPDLETLLAAGQVLAWRAGLAHYRAGALAVADSLPGDLALLAVGATGDWAAIRKRLEEDPWFVPEPSLARPVGEVGAFRGLGGEFRVPPLVALHAGHLVVSSGEDAWLHRGCLRSDVPSSDRRGALRPPRAALPNGMDLQGGALAFRGRTLPVSICGELTSAASNGTTLALTSSLTHAVVLVPLRALA